MPHSLFEPSDRPFLRLVPRLTFCNPFLPERVELERRALGADFVEADVVWSMKGADSGVTRQNAVLITDRVEALVREAGRRVGEGAGASEADLDLYRGAVLWMLYHRYEKRFYEAMTEVLDGCASASTFRFYRDFRADREQFLDRVRVVPPDDGDTGHLFACFFQVRRAFHHIVRHIIGGTMPAARLRAAVWQSIFSHDMQRYRRSLYHRMGDFSTLVTGPSGTGKELVAQAIGLSRYVPFDTKRLAFAVDFAGSFYALNLSALAPTLIESELFGHRRGAFTGALQDRAGWLEVCPPLGTVFLDEIGDLDPTLQVKLLRVIETRKFQRLGDIEDRDFQGKLVAATHRDLARAMQQRTFREDLYYRLCSDLIRTPSLKEQLEESSEVLRELLVFLGRRVVGSEAEAVAEEVEAWIGDNLGPQYPWPGNIRELEQCLRNVLIRRQYRPPRVAASGPAQELFDAAMEERWTAEELLCHYCTRVYHRVGSYQETARRLGLDRRTIKSKIDLALLEKL